MSEMPGIDQAMAIKRITHPAGQRRRETVEAASKSAARKNTFIT
jgi:hypothetical protein